jgi:hypothetical protein
MKEFQSVGRGLRMMENQLQIVPMSEVMYERLKKQYEDNAVKTDMYGNIVHPYTLH